MSSTGATTSDFLKWSNVDYQSGQINLRQIGVSDTVVNRLKTDDTEAPVPLTDLLAGCLLAWQAETTYAQPETFYRREIMRLPRKALMNMVGTRRLELLTSTVSR